MRERPEPSFVVLLVRILPLSDTIQLSLNVSLEPHLKPCAFNVDRRSPSEKCPRDENTDLFDLDEIANWLDE